MSNIKRYILAYDYNAEMVVEIDHDKCTDELFHEINNFWYNAKWRLQQADGNVIHAVLKMLFLRMIDIDFSENAALMFKYSAPEGWPNLDGSIGITLVSFSPLELDEEEVTIAIE
jgi:hypothetical protein